MLAVLASAIARLMNFSQRTAQRFNFPFVSEFLALSQFDEFKHFFHPVERLLEQFDNLRHFFNRLADGRRNGRSFQCRRNRRSGRQIGWGNLFDSTPATPSSTTDIVRRYGANRFGWLFVHHCLSEHDAKPVKSNGEL